MLLEAAYRKVDAHLREIGKCFIDEYLYDIEASGLYSYFCLHCSTIVLHSFFPDIYFPLM